MKYSNSITTAILVILFLIYSSNTNAESCGDDVWQKIAPQLGKVSNENLSREWQALEKECGKDEFFDYRHALIFIHGSDFDKAETIIKEALVREIDDYRYIHSAEGYMYFRKWGATGDPESKNKMLNAYNDLITLYPAWYMGYEDLGNVKAMLGEYPEAIKLLEKSISMGGSHISKTMLVASYFQLKDYDKVLSLAPDIVEQHPKVRSNKNFMLSAAWAYMYTGDLMTGQDVLLSLLDANPQIEMDRDFNIAVSFLKNKAEEIRANQKE